jgi:cytidylate kinase
MKDTIHEDPRIIAAAERQMQSWALARRAQEQSQPWLPGEKPSDRFGPYIAVSREAGVGGTEIARSVGEKLGWEVLDKELLDCMATRYRLSREMLELVDETTSSWVYDVFGGWLDHRLVSHESFVAHLVRVIVMAARQGNVVLVGRGAQFMLPRDRGLSVRIVGSDKYRIRKVMEDRGLRAAEAKQWVEQTDQGRRDLAQRFLHRDLTDPHFYDLIVNVEEFGQEATADLVVRTFHTWREQRQRRWAEERARLAATAGPVGTPA